MEGTRSASVGLGGLVQRSLLLLLVVAAAWLAAGVLAFQLRGWAGVGAASAAALICLLTGLLALVVSHFLSSAEMVLYQVSLSMALRTGIPLAACVLVQLQGGPLVAAGFIYYILGFYVITLAVETLLQLGWPRPDATRSVKA